MPLLRADLAPGPRAGIMLYSFATPQAGEVYHEVNQAREAGLDALFVAGGPHPSALPEEALEYFDYVVIGEGEETLPELIDAIETGRGAASVRGIAYRRGEEAIYTGDRPPVDLDCYPPFSSILAPIEITRGCPWGCAYCQTPASSGAACATAPSPSSPDSPAAIEISVSPPPTPSPMAPMADAPGWRRSAPCWKPYASRRSPYILAPFPLR